jgi:hypothetical protein
MVYQLIALSLLMMVIGPTRALASSCCGQTPTSYLVLYRHQKYSLSPSLGYTQSLGRVYESKDFNVWSKDKQRTVQTMNLNAAVSLGESSQFFASSGYLAATYTEQGASSSAGHFSDTQVGYSYELLPEYTFSPWKPVIFISALVNLPTGHSIYDRNELSEGSDVTGHDQWGAGLGMTARKVVFPFTLVLQGKVLRLLDKDFGTVRVSGFFDSSLAGFATYATRLWDISFTGGLTYNELTSRRLSTIAQPSAPTKVTTVIFSVQKPISDAVSMSFAVSDQSLLGSPQNTLLNRSYNMNISYNYF